MTETSEPEVFHSDSPVEAIHINQEGEIRIVYDGRTFRAEARDEFDEYESPYRNFREVDAETGEKQEFVEELMFTLCMMYADLHEV